MLKDEVNPLYHKMDIIDPLNCHPRPLADPPVLFK